MPRRNDLHRILIIGSGPIVIGQACEFDYSGTQAAKALRADGYEVILVNSNPATIMTDPELADKTYVEPLTAPYLEEIIRRERPDALLSTVGGQTGLNLSVELAERGVLEKYGVELIGAKIDAIKKAEDRLLFKDAMHKIGLETPQSQLINSVKGALEFAERIGYPCILRPSFTLGGTGGGIAYNQEELVEILERGIALSPVHEVLIEESALGWKEFELEVMRDLADNCIIICSIENFDPMGVHTGDSITVAPAQTLTDREYQMMRDGALRCLREIGVDTGGSNVQFAINPANGRMVIIEMNPRVSRSSALASKATGFPIAKIAAKLAVGYRLDEIPNDITRKTPACFEPTIDYVVVKIPKWAFEKFPGADATLGTQMKSVGEVMAIGRTFKQALWKGMRSLETGRAFGTEKYDPALISQKLITPTPDRLNYIRFALSQGYSVADIHELTSIDPWFLEQMKEVVDFEAVVAQASWPAQATPELFRRAKRYGISDVQLARTWGVDEITVRNRRKELGVRAVFSRVDTCAAEFESFTPYLYSNYESACEANPVDRKKVMILGSGPNRIGQGIEFDYCCCHASFALQEMGVESIMVNCNPETVSTDYDTSDRLYFEPLTLENVLNIYDTEKPDGVIVQFGGQTPLNLALPLKRLGVPIIGTDPSNIDLAEDRKLFGKLLDDLRIPCPANGTRHQRGGSLRGGPADRLPGAGASQLRAGRPRHGDRLRRGDDPPVHARGRDVLAGAPGAGRPLPGGCHRGRCGRPGRRRRSADRRHHGAHRRGRRTFGRQLVRTAAAVAAGRDAAHHRGLHRPARQGPERDRADERPVRHPERHGVCARSKPARVAHGAVCEQGDRRGAAEDRGRPDVGTQAAGLRIRPREAASGPGFRQVAGVPVQQIPRGGPGARPGNAQHGRGDGGRDQLR